MRNRPRKAEMQPRWLANKVSSSWFLNLRSLSQGALKNKVTGLGGYICYLISFRNQPTPHFFSSLLLLVRFWAFLGKGSSKTPQKYFYKKAMSKTFPEKILRQSTKFSISVFPRFVWFYRVFRCFFVTGVKRLYRKRFAKKLCRKVFQKNRQKKPKPIFSRFVLITFLGVSR
jgi:hypothetical protein